MRRLNTEALPGPRAGRYRNGRNARAGFRHLLVLTIAAVLVFLFGMVHGDWDPMHRWNRATADASFVLLAFTMGIGPAARFWPKLLSLIAYRRECGIYAVVLALAHALIIIEGWVQFDLLGLFGFVFHPDLGHQVMLQHGFGLANLVGIVALAYGFVLAATSNDRSVRFLGPQVWKFVQTAAFVLWALVVLHTAYFLFMHFLDFHRAVPAPNPLRWPFVAFVVLVSALRITASVVTWRQKRRPSRAKSEGAVLEADPQPSGAPSPASERT